MSTDVPDKKLTKKEKKELFKLIRELDIKLKIKDIKLPIYPSES